MASVQRSAYVDKTDKSEHLLRLAGTLSSNLAQNADYAAKRKAALAGVMNTLANNSRFKGASGAEATVNEYGTIQGNDKFDDMYKGGKADLSQAGYNKISREIFNKQNIEGVDKMQKEKQARLNPIDAAQDSIINEKASRGESGLTPTDNTQKQLDTVKNEQLLAAQENLKQAKEMQAEAAKWEDAKDEKAISDAFDTIMAGNDPEEIKAWEDLKANDKLDDAAKKTAYVNLIKERRNTATKTAQEKLDVENAAHKNVVTTRTEGTKTSKGQSTGGSTGAHEKVTMSRKQNDTEMELINAATTTESQQRLNDEIKTDYSTLSMLENLQNATNNVSGQTGNAFTSMKTARENFLNQWNQAGPKAGVAYEKGKYKIAGGESSMTHEVGANVQNNINMNNSNANKSSSKFGPGKGDKLSQQSDTVDFSDIGGTTNTQANVNGYGKFLSDTSRLSLPGKDNLITVKNQETGVEKRISINLASPEILSEMYATRGYKTSHETRKINGMDQEVLKLYDTDGNVMGQLFRTKKGKSWNEWQSIGIKGGNASQFRDSQNLAFTYTGQNSEILRKP